MIKQTTLTDGVGFSFASLVADVQVVLVGERDWLANLSNVSAVLFHGMPDLNWAGFYLFKENQLVLGPFQGRPACVRIAMNRGVCGAAASQRKTIVVPDVHQFPGHIACDSASNSEVVIPLISIGRLIGVMDLDSPTIGRFTEIDTRGLEAIAEKLVEGCDWPSEF